VSNENLAVAIHEIETVKNGKPHIVKAGSVFPIDTKNHGDLKKLGALREPTEAEVALYEKMLPKAEVKADGEGESTGTKGKIKAKAGKGTEGAGESGNGDIV
jgi:hypothetical protein